MRKAFALIAIIFFFHSLHAQVQIELRLKKGTTYCLSSQNIITVTKTDDGMEQQTINTEKGGFCYKIIEDHDSIFVAEAIFTHLSQDIQSPDGSSSFDSDRPNEGITGKILSNLVGKPFYVWLHNDYSWVKTQGLDSVVLHSYDEYKLPDTTRKYLDSVMLEMVKEFTRNDADLLAVLYSGNKIVQGNVWTTNSSSEHVIPTSDSLTYSLSETGDELFTVTGTGTVRSTTDQTNDGVEISNYNLAGTNEVTVVYYKNDLDQERNIAYRPQR